MAMFVYDPLRYAKDIEQYFIITSPEHGDAEKHVWEI
jgi:hypothetical protein